jgi:hypothetical protein
MLFVRDRAGRAEARGDCKPSAVGVQTIRIFRKIQVVSWGTGFRSRLNLSSPVSGADWDFIREAVPRAPMVDEGLRNLFQCWREVRLCVFAAFRDRPAGGEEIGPQDYSTYRGQCPQRTSVESTWLPSPWWNKRSWTSRPGPRNARMLQTRLKFSCLLRPHQRFDSTKDDAIAIRFQYCSHKEYQLRRAP